MNRLRHACRIVLGNYPLPDELEEFLIVTILARLAALESAVSSLQQQVSAAPSSADALAAVSQDVATLKSEVATITDEIGTDPAAPAEPATPSA